MKKEYFLSDGETYSLSEKYILSNLSKHAFYKKIEFLKGEFDEKLEKKQRMDSVRAKLSKFTNVIDNRECWLLHYDVS